VPEKLPSLRSRSARQPGVELVCRSGCRPPGLAELPGVARACLRAAGKRAGEVTILFTSDREMRSLNRRFRGLDRSTDVLSFPAEDTPARSSYLGDLAISLPAARRYARKAGWSIAEEVRFLLLHGLLHLLGYDHESDDGTMNRIQEELARDVLGLRIPGARLGEHSRTKRRRRAEKRP
jgi:probable rRNA maturation factor